MQMKRIQNDPKIFVLIKDKLNNRELCLSCAYEMGLQAVNYLINTVRAPSKL